MSFRVLDRAQTERVDPEAITDELCAINELDAAFEKRRTELLLQLAAAPTGPWLPRLQAHPHEPFWFYGPNPLSGFEACCALIPSARFTFDLEEAPDDAFERLVASGELHRVNYLYIEGRQASVTPEPCPSLELLHIDGAPANRHAAVELVSAFYRVRELYLRSGAIDEPTWTMVANRIPHVHHLDIYNCALGLPSIEALCESTCRLRRLELNGTGIDGRAVERIARSAHPLEQLDVSDTLCGDQGVQALTNARFLETLQWLSLANTKLTAQGAKALVSVEFPQLRRLDLSRNIDLGLEGLKAIAQSPHLAQVNDLDLESNGFTTEEHMRIITNSTTLHPQVREEWREALEHLRTNTNW